MTRQARAAALALVLGAAACAPVIIPAGPPTREPALLESALRCADGAELPLHAWLPEEGEPRAVILALHGFNDYGRFFEAPGRFLAARGIASYAYDQRSFGGAPNRGIWPGVPALVDDLRTAVRLVRQRHPEAPLFLLGESMGGAVALVAATGAEPPPVDGLILAAPAVRGRATMPWPQRAALWIAAHTAPETRVSGRGLGIRPSDNREMLVSLGQDPRVIKETRIDTLWGLVALMDAAVEAADRLDAPTLILYGDRDEIITGEPFRHFLARLSDEGRERRRVAVYDTGHHMLLRDLQAERVWTDIVAWAFDGGAPLPSGAEVSAGTCRGWNLCDKVSPSSADHVPTRS